MGWYSEVSRDINKLMDSISFYESELLDARHELKLTGNIEKAAASLPGMIEYRFNQLQEIEAILNYLNIELKRLKSKHFRKYLESYQRALSSRDVEKYVDGEEEVVTYDHLINEFALLRNKWLGVLKAFDQKSFSLNNVIRLRTAGMEDATL